jgi:hypothetical protein
MLVLILGLVIDFGLNIIALKIEVKV